MQIVTSPMTFCNGMFSPNANGEINAIKTMLAEENTA
jgi:hypothetical protein